MKKILSKILLNNITGLVIRKLFNNKINFRGNVFDCSSNEITNKTVAGIFFNAYESAEIRAINKFLKKDFSVIELGSSIGLLSIEIASKINNILYCFEANPFLLPVLNKNIEINKVKNIKTFNAAIVDSKYNNEQYYFIKGDNNTIGTITIQSQINSIAIPSITIQSILKENGINDFVLVCDIEGAELPILLNDTNIFNNCKQCIIEVHETSYLNVFYSLIDYIELFKKMNFSLVFRNDNVFVLNKNYLNVEN